MKMFIILRKGTARLGIDLEKIKKEIGADNKLIMLCCKSTYLSLFENKQLENFDEVQTIDEFNEDNCIFVISQLIKKYNSTDLKVATSSERCIDILGKVRDHFNITGGGYDLMHRYRDKVEMKKKLEKTGIPFPAYCLFDKKAYEMDKEVYLSLLESRLSFPLFVKPTNGTSSMETYLVNDLNEFKNICPIISQKEFDFELDEYIEGTLFHVDSIIVNGEVKFAFAGRYAYPCAEYLKGKPGGSIVLPAEDNLSKQLVEFSKKCSHLIGMPENGVTHMEMFYSKKREEFIFLEVAGRPPGGILSEMYKVSHDVDLFDIHFRIQLGLSCHLSLNQVSNAAVLAYPPSEGKVTELFSYNRKSQIKIKKELKLDDNLKDVRDLHDVAFSLILSNKSFQTLEDDFDHLKENPPFYISKNTKTFGQYSLSEVKKNMLLDAKTAPKYEDDNFDSKVKLSDNQSTFEIQIENNFN